MANGEYVIHSNIQTYNLELSKNKDPLQLQDNNLISENICQRRLFCGTSMLYYYIFTFIRSA